MRPRLVTTALVGSAALLSLPACSADDPGVAVQARKAPSAPASSDTARDPLAGTWSTPPIRVSRMVQVAREAGFRPADVAEFREGWQDTHEVVYTIKLVDGFWVVFESRDGGAATDQWSGPYEVLDGSVVRAGAKPCGPITYDYEVSHDDLSLRMTDNQCVEADGTVPAGELIAQTTIYQSAPYHRIG